MVYKYPIDEYPYSKLVHENRNRNRNEPEFELLGQFRLFLLAFFFLHKIMNPEIFTFFERCADALPEMINKHFHIAIEYAKADETDILCQISATNVSNESASLHILPHLWARNTWSWGYSGSDGTPAPRPNLTKEGTTSVTVDERHMGKVRAWHLIPVFVISFGIVERNFFFPSILSCFALLVNIIVFAVALVCFHG
jgi:hypothetical protein